MKQPNPTLVRVFQSGAIGRVIRRRNGSPVLNAHAAMILALLAADPRSFNHRTPTVEVIAQATGLTTMEVDDCLYVLERLELINASLTVTV